MKLVYILLLIVTFYFTSLSQTIKKTKPLQQEHLQSYPFDVLPNLQERYQKTAVYIEAHPDMFMKMKLQKSTSWNFNVGTQKLWYAYNFSTKSEYLTSSTCRAVGNHCYVFVEDSLWGTKVNQIAVDSVQNAFDNRTPANGKKGIFEMDVNAFGDPPDVDSDPKIIILIMNILDSYKGSGGYTAGYFDPTNETNQFQSNQAEIYYLDANPVNLNTPSGLQLAMSTTAHEFQHMINWNYHKTNPILTFINEGCSMTAELYCGYPLFNQSLYDDETNHYLFDWRGNDVTKVLNDYSRAQKFFLYYYDQFGIGIFKYIVQDQSNGIPLLNDALSQDGQSLNFNSAFLNWLIANKINDRTVNQSYGYNYPGIEEANSTVYYNPNISLNGYVNALAAKYISFKEGSNLKINFSTSSSSLIVKAIEEGDNLKQVVNVPLNTEFSVPEYGTVIKTIHFVIINTSNQINADYSVKASGTALLTVKELKWDNSEPTGYFKLSPSDTICVSFNAYPGGQLDSIRVALRNAGSIQGGIWEFRGDANIRPTPLDKKLLYPFTASISTSSTLPYPVPYKNWSTVNLKQYGIKTDKPFAVGFVIGGNPSVPGVMVTDYPGQQPYHSYTFLNNPGSGSPDWFYLTGSDSTVAIYLVRAYVSSYDSTIVNAPATFSLSPNFPNPFNNTTKINFSLHAPEKVRIAVYNVLGEKVVVLVNKEFQEGSHQVIFNGRGLSSGVYFYRIKAGNFTDVKKMVFVK